MVLQTFGGGLTPFLRLFRLPPLSGCEPRYESIGCLHFGQGAAQAAFTKGGPGFSGYLFDK